MWKSESLGEVQRYVPKPSSPRSFASHWPMRPHYEVRTTAAFVFSLRLTLPQLISSHLILTLHSNSRKPFTSMAASLRPLRLCRASSTTALIAKCPLAYVPSQQPNTTSQHLHPRQPQRRSYAVTKRAPLSKNSRTWGTISIDGVTSHDFSRSDMVGRGDYFHHTPEQYFDCLQKFASAASGSDQRWVYRLNERKCLT